MEVLTQEHQTVNQISEFDLYESALYKDQKLAIDFLIEKFKKHLKEEGENISSAASKSVQLKDKYGSIHYVSNNISKCFIQRCYLSSNCNSLLVSANVLKSAAFFAGRKDIRYQLNGIHIVCDNGKAMIEASNGSIAARYELGPCNTEKKIDVIIPIEAIDNIVKNSDTGKSKHRNIDDILISIDNNNVLLENKTSKFSNMCEVIKEKFFDLDRVFVKPNDISTEEIKPAHYDIDLLVAIKKSVVAITFSNRPCPFVLDQRGQLGGVITCGDQKINGASDFLGIIMPIR